MGRRTKGADVPVIDLVTTTLELLAIFLAMISAALIVFALLGGLAGVGLGLAAAAVVAGLSSGLLRFLTRPAPPKPPGGRG